MGDTENGSWGSRELGGFIRQEEARKEREAMKTHTPGPWRIEKYTDTTTRDGERIRAGNNLIVVNEVWGASLSECDANYRLVAAAPELLEACKQAKKHLERDLVEPGRTVFWNLVAAIAKAEGR